jgi:hypothetical protein
LVLQAFGKSFVFGIYCFLQKIDELAGAFSLTKTGFCFGDLRSTPVLPCGDPPFDRKSCSLG